MAANIHQSIYHLMRAIFFYLLTATLLFSCKKETEELKPELPSEYMPTVTGKYITYRLDSTVVLNFGATIATHSYQEKHQVDALTTDNLGRPAYRVFRYIRDTAGATAWQPSGTYFITATTNNIEVVENNLRFLKLAGPVREGNMWTGNKFLPTDPYGPLYEFFNDDGMYLWEYNYAETGASVSLRGKQYNDVITVQQVDDVSNIPVTTDAVGYMNKASEKYAKGIGLIFQDITLLEYQPTYSPRPGFRGFGVKRTILEHN